MGVRWYDWPPLLMKACQIEHNYDLAVPISHHQLQICPSDRFSTGCDVVSDLLFVPLNLSQFSDLNINLKISISSILAMQYPPQGS